MCWNISKLDTFIRNISKLVEISRRNRRKYFFHLKNWFFNETVYLKETSSNENQFFDQNSKYCLGFFLKKINGRRLFLLLIKANHASISHIFCYNTKLLLVKWNFSQYNSATFIETECFESSILKMKCSLSTRAESFKKFAKIKNHHLLTKNYFPILNLDKTSNQ